MINIISKSILEKRTRGPKKVAENLIAGFEKIGYPYVINRAFEATNRLWIHDDVSALKYIKNLPERVKVVIGPNLFVNPEEIPTSLDLNRAVYLQPSENVEEIWKKRGMNRAEMVVWPAGVDTNKFQPSVASKEFVLVYLKNRIEEELREVLFSLTARNISYRLIRYGSYEEEEYKLALEKAKFIIWVGGSESQGLALEEALSMNVPALVLDQDKSEHGIELTAAPYFSEECGRKIRSIRDFPAALTYMEEKWPNFQSRQFILKNLSLEKQARDFVDIFDIHFDLPFGEGLREKIQKEGYWQNARPWFRAYVRLKEMLK